MCTLPGPHEPPVALIEHLLYSPFHMLNADEFIVGRGYYHPPFRHVEMETQKGEATCPGHIISK